MKKNKNIILILIFIIVVITCSLSFFTIKNNRITNDEKKFKNEYESLNGKKSLSTKKNYLNIKIPEKNGIKYASGEEIIKLLDEGTGVIYFGFPECPWCRNMIVPLLEEMQKAKTNIYYYNAYSIRDNKELDNDGKIITHEQGTENYYKILELLGDNASVYEGLNDDSIKRLYFPTVVFVKNGKIVDIHVSTVESQKDPYIKLTKSQIKELKKIYQNGYKKLQESYTSDICTGKESC